MTSRSISPEGLALIKAHEGRQNEPVQLPDGSWLVGYGHVRIGEAGAAVAEAEAAELLALDLAPVERMVNEASAALTQSQFDALVSFAFSIGAEAFAQSQVLRRVKSGDMLAAACAMEAWRKSEARGELEIVDALVRRRAAEKALFLKDDAQRSAASALIRPKLDHAAAVLGAPIAFAPAPAPGALPVKQAKPEPGQRLAEILKSEPATEVLLLTQVVAEDEPVDEIATAHAKPVARTLKYGRDAIKRAAEAGAEQGERGFIADANMQVLGLSALLTFGLGLISMGAAALFNGAGEAADVVRAMALAVPGLAAAAFGAYGLWRRRPALKPARIR